MPTPDASIREPTATGAALVAALPGAVLLADAGARVVMANPAFCRLFGLTQPPEDLVGVDCSQATTVAAARLQDPESFLSRMAEWMAAREPAMDEVRFLDGRVCEREYVPLGSAAAPEGHLWMYCDVTSRVGADDLSRDSTTAELTARELAHESLADIDELRRQLLATASHELRTPLTSMMSFVNLLREGEPLSDEQAQFVDVIGRNAERLLGMVNDILLLARFGSGAEELDLDDVNLPGLVTEVVHDSTPEASARGITMDLVTESGPPLEGDRNNLSQLFVNLIGNAVKFTREGGHIDVSVVRAGAGWRCSIADNGIGVPTAEADQLFGQFFRASNARRAGIQGSGLGLAISRAIVQLHGGSIRLVSCDGEDGRDSGTTVTLTLPDAR